MCSGLAPGRQFFERCCTHSFWSKIYRAFISFSCAEKVSDISSRHFCWQLLSATCFKCHKEPIFLSPSSHAHRGHYNLLVLSLSSAAGNSIGVRHRCIGNIIRVCPVVPGRWSRLIFFLTTKGNPNKRDKKIFIPMKINQAFELLCARWFYT